MTSTLFVEWFHISVVKQVIIFQIENNLNGKVLLLIAQLRSDDGEVVTMFLPLNCTLLLQSMDQNAIRLTNLY